jgi:hypothetical protein
MSKWSFSNPNWTPTQVADTATMTANGACFLQGGAATQMLLLSEIYMGGQAGASAVNDMVLARDSTVAVTAITLGTNGKNAPLDVFAAALAAPQVPGFSATTMPQRAATLHLLQLTFNAFGGIVRWVAYPGEEIKVYGLSANIGEVSLSCSNATGTPGAIASHLIYEPS